jgi:hypothetical protein
MTKTINNIQKEKHIENKENNLAVNKAKRMNKSTTIATSKKKEDSNENRINFNQAQKEILKNYPIKFTDVKMNDKGKLLYFKSTVSNFEAILDYLEVKFKYNELTTEFDVFYNSRYEKDRNRILGEIYSTAKKYNMSLTMKEMELYIGSLGLKYKYNPWQEMMNEYVEKYKNKVDSLKEYMTIKKIFSALQIQDYYDKDFAFTLFKKFLLHFVANIKLDDYGCNGVFTLQGEQNCGKTSFFRLWCQMDSLKKEFLLILKAKIASEKHLNIY